MKVLLICMLCVVTVYAQFDSPPPPRIQIPGAIHVGARPSGFRQGRLQSGPIPGALPRIRRPGRPSFKSVDASPRPSLQSIEEPAKPVTEEPEDELIDINTPTAFVPNSFFSTPEPQNNFFDVITTTSQPKPPIVYNPTPYQQSTPTVLKPEPIRPTPYRPLAAQPSFSPIRNEGLVKQPVRLQPLSTRPQRPSFRPEPRPQIFEEDDVPAQPIRQYTRPQEPIRNPIKNAPSQRYTSSNSREKKPVAQIIRKYREENEDGSITWGFENDDGSFKEEIIGIDCITRGKYGYVDPDGLKREYNYETGIACDRAKEEQEEKGFIDYQENKAVLPNGIILDLSAMGKKSRRPYKPQ